MKTLDLNGAWQLRAVDTHRHLPPEKRTLIRWMPASVPGTVHLDLMRNGHIPDPYLGMNENTVQWIDSVSWLYRRTFNVPADILAERKVVLVAEGLDTFARIRCNGMRVGDTDNMFIPHRLDIARLLKHGENVLQIFFDSPRLRAQALEKKCGPLGVALEPHRVYVRKAQYSFGWDWGPRLTTSGIWRNILLEAYSESRIRFPQVKITDLTKSEATVELAAEVERPSGRNVNLVCRVEGHGNNVEGAAHARGKTCSVRLRVPRPRLWWPNGMGDQPLYDAVFTLTRGEKTIDSVRIPFGIRTVRLLQEKDRQGRSFVFEINGKKTFCRGANWIPPDCFLPRAERSGYEKLLMLARNANINMLRVWGGGVYEDGYFYELCDRHGLMVWQDFMFACGEYPEEPWFLKSVRVEAESVVKRLRNHPSIVIWCGNNECEWLFCMENRDKSPDDMTGSRIFRTILPSACAKHDGTRPFWRSSPFGSGFPNDESNGNHHQWEVWSGWKDYRQYQHDHARFVTEFGFQAAANRKTADTVTVGEDRHPQSEAMEHHNKQTEGQERLIRFMVGHYRLGMELDDFIYKSQLTQAEALKSGVEHWRRRKFRTAGALFWQLNDCWPVTSWSVVDYGFRPKAAYYYAKKFFSPLLVSMQVSAGHIGVWVVNDLLHGITGRVQISLRSFEGQILWRREFPVAVGPNRSLAVRKIEGRDYAHCDPRLHYLLAKLSLDGELTLENRAFLVEPKHMLLPTPHIEWALAAASGRTHLLTLESDVFVKSLELQMGSHDVEFEDNYFDMEPREKKLVEVRSDLPLDELRKNFVVKWLS